MDLNCLSNVAVCAIEQTNIELTNRQLCQENFMERFLLFNFSEHRFPYLDCDCEWFYELANKQTCIMHQVTQEFWSSCATFGVFQLIFTRILCYSSESEASLSKNSKDQFGNEMKTLSSSKILDLFEDKVGTKLIYYKKKLIIILYNLYLNYRGVPE